MVLDVTPTLLAICPFVIWWPSISYHLFCLVFRACWPALAHRQLPGSYPFAPSILSSVFPSGRSPMSERNCSNVFLVTNKNAASTIQIVFVIIRVGASRPHLRPRIVSLTLPIFSGMTMLSACRPIAACSRAVYATPGPKPVSGHLKCFPAFPARNIAPYALCNHFFLLVEHVCIAGGRVDCNARVA